MAISCGIITTAIVLATHKKETSWKLWPSKAVAGNNIAIFQNNKNHSFLYFGNKTENIQIFHVWTPKMQDKKKVST